MRPCILTDPMGHQERVVPSEVTFMAVLHMLELGDVEHSGVSVAHPSGWCLSVSASGICAFEHLEDPDVPPRHIRPETRAAIVGLMMLVGNGRFEELESLDWRPGYF